MERIATNFASSRPDYQIASRPNGNGLNCNAGKFISFDLGSIRKKELQATVTLQVEGGSIVGDFLNPDYLGFSTVVVKSLNIKKPVETSSLKVYVERRNPDGSVTATQKKELLVTSSDYQSDILTIPCEIVLHESDSLKFEVVGGAGETITVTSDFIVL